MAVREVWHRWTPELAAVRPDLARAVDAFDAGNNPAAVAAAHFLRVEALPNHPSTVTRIALIDGRVEGFYALCAGEVLLHDGQRQELGFPRARQPAALLAWIARRAAGRLPGEEIFMHALVMARRVAAEQGAVVLACDPFDRASERVWRAEPYHFRRSRTESSRGTNRLWIPLFPEGT